MAARGDTQWTRSWARREGSEHTNNSTILFLKEAHQKPTGSPHTMLIVHRQWCRWHSTTPSHNPLPTWVVLQPDLYRPMERAWQNVKGARTMHKAMRHTCTAHSMPSCQVRVNWLFFVPLVIKTFDLCFDVVHGNNAPQNVYSHAPSTW